MRFGPVLALLGAALLVAACGSTTSASKANFAKAISTTLTKRCISVDPTEFATLGNGSYPVDITRRGSQLDAFVKAGLLTDKRGGFGHVYSLTAAGKRALDPSSLNHTAFCAGHYKLDEVVDWTVPGHFMGLTTSQVTYTYSPVDIQPWAQTVAVKGALSKRFMHKQRGQATLVLKNDGWSVSSLGL